jgi:hypothetical protein
VLSRPFLATTCARLVIARSTATRQSRFARARILGHRRSVAPTFRIPRRSLNNHLRKSCLTRRACSSMLTTRTSGAIWSRDGVLVFG